MNDTQESQTHSFDEAKEHRVAIKLAVVVLVTLTLVKPLGGIAVIGSIAFTLAALMQLYLPMHRADSLGLDLSVIGLHWKAWRHDLRIVMRLVLITFPPYIVAHHLYMTEFHAWADALGLHTLTPFIPQRHWAPQWPTDLQTWSAGSWVFLTMVATHVLGVALPEETFYRGYLQPRLEHLWPPKQKVLGVRIGKAAVVTSALFALGHFLGEWNPMRLGPFIPGLVFAWQRNATGSVLGAITYHALCNVLGEILFSLYQPL